MTSHVSCILMCGFGDSSISNLISFSNENGSWIFWFVPVFCFFSFCSDPLVFFNIAIFIFARLSPSPAPQPPGNLLSLFPLGFFGERIGTCFHFFLSSRLSPALCILHLKRSDKKLVALVSVMNFSRVRIVFVAEEKTKETCYTLRAGREHAS